MSDYYRTEGFVFKKEDRMDADRIFSVFTKDFGRLEISGKAIRKITSKLRSGAEIFSFSDIEFIQGRNKKTLTDAVAREKFKNIYQSPEKLHIAYAISDILDNFISGQEEDQVIFNFLGQVFSILNNFEFSTFNLQLFYYYFFWNFIAVMGYALEVSQCAGCQEALHPDRLYFSNKEGGILCKNCAAHEGGSKKVEPNAVKILRIIFKKDWEMLSKIKVEKHIQKSLREISAYYYQFLKSNLHYEKIRNN